MSPEGVVLDVDGTLIRGREPIEGAIEAVESLRERGLPVAFVSNNPIRTREAYAERLARHGFSLDAEELITAGTITAEYLAREHAAEELYIVGEEGLEIQLREAGLSLTDEYDRADTLIASIDREFSYDDLKHALWALADGTRFLGTDPDRTIPTEDREVPGSGAIINAITGVTGREPDAIMGKPAPSAVEALERTLGLDAADCLIVGDRLDTDIAMGECAGMTTVLVRTGVTDERALASATIDPDHVLESISDLGSLL
ncbi:HAD-IIA family hydrolase [Halalkalicoccus jeotgali]|uniref:HAD superfamily hydrolase n=1 Tax=Halalkalicoccus jeotgali (strain DSM 18796 / CECT 7217 / JCM 14584 / KCTC 4019 / B3) TaxID=795797 RepID=D8J3Y2_HALJB|nr:HAD-IIA family hydrolase [Halalkalicoccus jeotgali]ADJ15374.1 HAD-superfamily hydrolase, subfamily IIA [Halalkalicoccus jeotgali B3]ELY35413.1 HAD superfamily hydrolase [Halalkalicoccus jeotgali B3]